MSIYKKLCRNLATIFAGAVMVLCMQGLFYFVVFVLPDLSPLVYRIVTVVALVLLYLTGAAIVMWFCYYIWLGMREATQGAGGDTNRKKS